MDMQQDEPLIEHHIEFRTTRSGEQKPYIAGTRVGVDTIYVCHELQGMSPDEILEAFPHLSLGRIHAALAYFYDHSDAVREQLRRDQEFADQLEAKQGSTKYSRLRDAIMGSDDGGNGNPVSPG